MSKASNQSTALGMESSCWIRSNYQLLEGDLPEPGEPFALADLPPRLRERWKILRSHNVIETVGEEFHRYESGKSRYRHVWGTTRPAWRLIQQLADDDGPLPCGHSGFCNVRDGAYRCSVCDRELSRDELEAALGGEADV